MKTPRVLAWLIPLVLVAFAPLFAHAAPVVSITLNPTKGIPPYTSTITWTVTGAVSCAASDGWTGSKTASGGTQQVTVSAATLYTLTCTAADGSTTTIWTPPSTNTDGSPYTDNAGYNIYRGTTATNLTKLKSVGPAITTYQDSNLATGPYYYAVTSVNSASLESAQGKSNPSPINVVGSSTAASASAGIQTVPSAPSGVITTTVTTTTSTTVTTGAAPSP